MSGIISWVSVLPEDLIEETKEWTNRLANRERGVECVHVDGQVFVSYGLKFLRWLFAFTPERYEEFLNIDGRYKQRLHSPIQFCQVCCCSSTSVLVEYLTSSDCPLHFLFLHNKFKTFGSINLWHSSLGCWYKEGFLGTAAP